MKSRWTRLGELNAQRRRLAEAELSSVRSRQQAALDAAARAQQSAEQELRSLSHSLLEEGLDAAQLLLRQEWARARQARAAQQRDLAIELEPESRAALEALLATRREEEKFAHLREREAVRQRGELARRDALVRDESALRTHVRRAKNARR